MRGKCPRGVPSEGYRLSFNVHGGVVGIALQMSNELGCAPALAPLAILVVADSLNSHFNCLTVGRPSGGPPFLVEPVVSRDTVR